MFDQLDLINGIGGLLGLILGYSILSVLQFIFSTFSVKFNNFNKVAPKPEKV